MLAPDSQKSRGTTHEGQSQLLGLISIQHLHLKRRAQFFLLDVITFGFITKNPSSTYTPPTMSAPNFTTPPPTTSFTAISFPTPQILLVTLSRPKALNCISSQGHQELHSLFSWLDAEPSLRCGIITGAGRAFCAGADLKGTSSLFSCFPAPLFFLFIYLLRAQFLSIG